MFEWIRVKSAAIVRRIDLSKWPGGQSRPRAMHPTMLKVEGIEVLQLPENERTTVVPLELGGVMLVSVLRCSDEKRLSDQLDALPVTGWQLSHHKLRSDGGAFVLIDGAEEGQKVRIVSAQRTRSDSHLRFWLAAGQYDIESMGPYAPDAQTEVFLTRLIRCSSP